MNAQSAGSPIRPAGGLRHFTALCALALLTSVAASQTPGGPADPPRGAAREAMWPAPTVEDWAKPVQITFQRTWEDAVRVSQETGKPILVCINMDGEIASEHWAGIRYRDPEIAKLYEPYVCVIASVYRHNPVDYDDQGNRILCPRFGSVTCSEHIWIEPVIFEKFCDGQRVAPRHIAVDLEGNEVYDIFYRNDTASIVTDLERLKPEGRPSTVVRGDRPIVERVASRDIRDRVAVEGAYREGDRELRERLLKAALEHKETEQLDLLRLAIFGLDVDMSRAARETLLQANSLDATQLVSDALQLPLDPAEREALIAKLKTLGEVSVRARYLAGVHQGLSSGAGTVDPSGWTQQAAGGTYPSPETAFGGSGRITHVEDTTRAVEERPEDPVARLELAEATLAQALKASEAWPTNPRLAELAARHLYEDALRFGNEAEALGSTGWRTDTVIALAAYYSGDLERAYERAAVAVKAIPPGDTGWNSMAVITVFGEGRWKAIKAAVKEGKDWPPEWLADLHSAYSILLHHPLGTDGQVVWHYDLLDWLGVHHRATRVLREGLDRFLDSAPLHEKLRERVMRFRGAEGLEAAYDELLARHEAAALLEPFAGIASVTAAEAQRRQNRGAEARTAYTRAVVHFETAADADPGYRAQANRAIALALAGSARVAYQMDDDAAALADILASYARDPGAAGTRDEMGMTPGETGQMLLARLQDRGKTDEAARLDEALKGLDPELLAPDIGLTEPK